MTREIRGMGSPGRTLIELIVGAAAGALLTVAVVSLLVAGLRWQRPDEAALRRQQAVRNGLDWIVRDARRATDIIFLADGLEIVWPREVRTYRVMDGSLWLFSDRGSRVVAQPVTELSASLDPIRRYVRVELRSQDGDRVYRSVSHIMPRAVVR